MSPISLPALGLLTLKIFFILAAVIYVIFAAVIVRQEQLMADVLEEHFEPVLRILAIVHLAAAILVLFLTFLLL